MHPSSRGLPSAHVMRLDIQGLRAIAVLAVIADHVVGAPAGGFVGVDVFFVISGFLITGLLLREAERTGTISFRRFYERRAKRILPAALVVIAFTLAASYALLGRARADEVASDGLFSALFVGNWRFAEQGVDYFQQGTPPSPLQHFWSLGVEEQFYLVWPWLMLLLVAIGAHRGWAAARARKATAFAILAIIACSFAWGLVETQTNPAYAYFSTLSRAWELGLGALLAFIPRFSATVAARRVMAWLGLAMIAASLVVSGDSPLWPAPLALLPVAGAMLVILSGTGEERGWSEPWILRNRVAVHVGDLSYSLYLWHFPVAILLPTLMPQGTWWFVATALAVTLVLSELSYHLIEDPARRAAWLVRRDGRIRGFSRAWIPTTATIAAIAVVGGGIAAGAQQLRPEAAAVPSADVVEAPSETAAPTAAPTAEETVPPRTADECWGAASTAHAEACAGAEFPALAPAPDALEGDTDDAYACYSVTDTPLNSCAHGDEGAGTRVALVGDSHAAALLPALLPQLGALDWRLETFLGRGCRLMEDPDRPTDCDAARPATNERLASGDYDLVIAAATRKDDVPADASEPVLRAIEQAGTRVVVVEDNPLPDEASVACTTRIGVGPDSDCAMPRDAALGSPDRLAEAARDAGAGVVSLGDLYCTDDACPMIIGGVIVYRDAAGHITATWARTLSPYLAEAIIDEIGAA